MAEIKDIKVIAGCIVLKGEEFVLVKEKKPAVYGLWNIPAGKLDVDEIIPHGAVREVEEETGLRVKPKAFLGVYQHRAGTSNIVFHVFVADYVSGELSFKQDELLDAQWFSYDAFEKLPVNAFRSADVPVMIKHLREKRFLPLDAVSTRNF